MNALMNVQHHIIQLNMMKKHKSILIHVKVIVGIIMVKIVLVIVLQLVLKNVYGYNKHNLQKISNVYHNVVQVTHIMIILINIVYNHVIQTMKNVLIYSVYHLIMNVQAFAHQDITVLVKTVQVYVYLNKRRVNARLEDILVQIKHTIKLILDVKIVVQYLVVLDLDKITVNNVLKLAMKIKSMIKTSYAQILVHNKINMLIKVNVHHIVNTIVMIQIKINIFANQIVHNIVILFQ